MPIPKGVFQLGMCDEKLACRSSLQKTHDIGDRVGRREAQEEVNVVRLNFLGQDNKAPIRANLAQKSIQCSSDLARQNASSVLRAPNHMVSSLIHTIPRKHDLNHVQNYTT